jgi:hypothetical protein
MHDLDEDMKKKGGQGRSIPENAVQPTGARTTAISVQIQALSRYWLWLAVGMSLVQSATAQTPDKASSDGHFFTTTGFSLAFPVGNLQTVAKNGRGTSFAVEYKVTPMWSIMGAWDNNTLPIQSAKLLAKLDPALRSAITELKGDYITNALGLYGVRYIGKRRVRPFLTGGAGLNIITLPAPNYNPQTQLLSLESASHLTVYAMAGLGMNWQFSKPAAMFGEIDAYVVPAETPAAQSNSFLTTKIGLRFPLF